MDCSNRIVKISHNKSIKQNIGICNICYIKKLLSKCKRCTLVICKDCIKKYNKKHCPDTTKCIQIYTSNKIKNIHININI